MGSILEGEVESGVNETGNAVSRLLAKNLQLVRHRSSEVRALVDVLRRTHLRCPDAGRQVTRLHWQGVGGRPHAQLLPKSVERALVISPFLSTNFVREILRRSSTLHVISNPGAYQQLDDVTFAALMERGVQQNSPCLYAVTECEGKEDDGRIEGLHAKVLLLDDGRDADAVTYLGSANATAAGWAIGTTGNAESLIELRPGIGIDRFLRDFVLNKKGESRPWIREYQAEDREEVTEEERVREQLRRTMLAAAAIEFRVSYSTQDRKLVLAVTPGAALPQLRIDEEEVAVQCVPLALHERADAWTCIHDVVAAPVAFANADLSDVTAFVLLRGTVRGVTLSRMAIAELDLSDVDLNSRDNAARQELRAQFSTADVLSALILGLGRVRSNLPHSDAAGIEHPQAANNRRALQQVTIERTLQAVARNPELIRELRLLLPDDTESQFTRFRDDLEEVLKSGKGARR
jgi:hypothetical protein